MIYTWGIAFLTTLFLLSNQRYRWFYIIFKTYRRDLTALVRFSKLNFLLWKHERNELTVPKIFTQVAKRNPQKIALHYENQHWTFAQLEKFSNQIAHFFKSEGYKRGDTISLILESKPEYVGIWLGLSKIGVKTALINYNLVGEPLIHSLKISKATGIIYGSEFRNVVADISSKVPEMKRFEFNTEKQPKLLQGSVNLHLELQNQPQESPQEEIQKGKPKDQLIFIYTSGTTGLPKAAIITNMRYLFMALGFYYMANLKEDDVVYDPLPLYHSAGNIAGVGQCLLQGLSVALRKKFSATNFWTDCAKYNCTVAQYIGEICRYILAAHKKHHPVQHSVKKIIGNGLRPLIWTEFKSRFNIDEIYEFYGATEGNSNLINIDSTLGAVGFVPRYATPFYPVTLVQCDEATGEPIRNKKGNCIRCTPGEPGVFIGKIHKLTSVNDFSGYVDQEANNKKMIRNVFKNGDLYFNSGDILVQDELGYYYFKDRTGDTFRWKGENVSTSEVEALISICVNLSDSVVYGVQIPDTEGRAGMVAIADIDSSVDLELLAMNLKKNLPAYAIPMFVRIMKSVSMTGTFKLQKMDLQNEGFNVNTIKDSIYFYDVKTTTYIPLTKKIYQEIISGKIRL